MNNTHIITISGPSLSGKTEFTKMLKNDYDFEIVTSVTTRPQRAGEVNGIDYNFITKEEYLKLEMVQKTDFNGFLYGVSEEEITSKKEKPLLWVIAPQSLKQVEDYCSQKNWTLTKVFISNPEDVIFERLFTRYSNDSLANPKVYAKRLKVMLTEELKWLEDSKKTDIYDKKIYSFVPENTKEVLNEFVQYIEQKSNPKSKPKMK